MIYLKKIILLRITMNLFPYENCFEKEDDYFAELPIFDKVDEVVSDVSNFMIGLANMSTLDIETKLYIKNNLINIKVLSKKHNRK